MTHDEFRAALKSLGLTNRDFAARVDLWPATLSQWGRPDRGPIPAWVPLLLDAWKQTGVPSKRQAMWLQNRTEETDAGHDQAVG